MGLKADTVVDKIHDTVVQLHPERQQKVYTYAEKQLNEQRNPDNVVSLDEVRVERNLDEPAFNVDVDGIVAAGYGAFNDDRNESMDTVKIPDSAIPSHYDYCFKVVGDSMHPTYDDGEFVFVQKTQDVTNGMIAVVDIDDMTFIKKLIFEQDRLCLRSLNDDVDEETGERIYPDFYADDTDNIQVIGKVVGSYAFK
ncbi:S24 family peptidase [Lacticaseibacillus paracasei]|uniref:S24 family peptidase n=1 Tax=Lacticaseibacillus paracasei TaxID=1597 RepID=UPI0021E7C8C3|nr:S24 family peptidase [Lacticaseibacillus paracasei]UYI59298.1 S24 family peptidase [Lacticaseibacillus paracasei]